MKYGLVLEGGGSKGAYQIGACKALAEMGVKYNCVAGTSVGALNGVMVVQGDVDKAYSMWSDISFSQIISIPGKENETAEPTVQAGKGYYEMLKGLKAAIMDKGLNIDPLVKLVNENADEKKLRRSKIDFAMVTVDLTARKPVEVYKKDIPEGKLADYLIASASFPGFKLRYIDGDLFIDGGLYNTLPINLVRDKGIKDIIVIRTFGHGRVKKMDTTDLNITEISPVESLGPLLDFSSKLARKNLTMGYYDAIKAFKGLKGTKYYIEPNKEKDFFLHYLNTLDNEKIKKICSLFGAGEGAPKRMLFEVAIPRIAEMMSMSKDADYDDICFEMLDRVAEISGVERFKIYKLNEILNEISRLYKPSEDRFFKDIPQFLRKSDVLSKVLKTQIISSIAGVLFVGIEVPMSKKTGRKAKK